MDIAEWFETQRALQVEAYGTDPGSLEGEDLAVYVTWNALALSDELHELLQEIQWKPWANDMGRVDVPNAALVEFVDMLHFVANLALAFGFTPEDVSEAYRMKVQINKDRQSQEGGYDAVASKCPHCHRDLEEVGTKLDTAYLDGIRIVVISCKACSGELDRSVA